MRDEPVIHLLIPKEFQIYCTHKKPGAKLSITMYPSKANCANCLTQYRHRGGFVKNGNGVKGRGEFKIAWTSRHAPYPGDPDANKL